MSGEVSRSRASSVSSCRVVCAACALLSAAHDTEPVLFLITARDERAERGHRRRGATWIGRLNGFGCGSVRRVRIWPLGQPQKKRATCAAVSRFRFTSTPTPTNQRKPSANAKRRDQSRVPRCSPPPMPALCSLITRGDEKQNRLRVMRRAQKRAGGADDATRRNRRRTRTTHLAGYPAASNGALIRLRKAENQSAPLPCLPFISHRR